MPYTKLHQCIVTSTIWREPDHIRIAWVTMVALADKNGEVMASIPGLADMCRISVEQCEEALACFRAPDPYSRTKDLDGVRIQDIDGGWFLVNHGKYRDMASREDSRAKASARTARYRKNKALQTVDKASPTVDSDGVSTVDVYIAEADTDTEAEAAKQGIAKGKPVPKTKKAPPISLANAIAIADELGASERAKTVLTNWLEYKTETFGAAGAYRPRGWRTLLNDKLKLSDDDLEAAVNASIASGYRGIFAPTTNGKAKPASREYTPPKITDDWKQF